MSKDNKIYLAPHNPDWAKKFEIEKGLIEETIGSYITGGIHHVGSTAIPEMSAKPIIDIMVGVKSLEETKPCIELLKKISYCYFPYKTEQMHWFCKPSEEHRTHHLYLIETTNPEFNARLAFRDYLINNSEEASEYEKLKQGLIDKFSDDREAYTQAKTDFIRQTVNKALNL